MPVEEVDRAAGPHADRRVTAHALLQVLLDQVLGRGPHPLHRHCGVCGGPHGRPRLDGGGPWVGVSTAPGLVAAAVGLGTRVGVDVERDARCAFPGFASVALAPGERSEDPARTWTRKEALLKALGTGLETDPREVLLDGPRVVRWPGPPASLHDVPAPEGWTCSAAALAPATALAVHDGDALLRAALAAAPAPPRR